MREPTPKFEMKNHPAHLEYGAVPLDTWNARYPDDWGMDYVNGSLGHIDDKVQEARAEAVMSGLFSRDMAAVLTEFMKESLYDSQLHRIKLSMEGWSHDLLDEDDERVQRALLGTATPDELMDILIDNPKLGSVELAKLSHPMKPLDSLPMDADVEATLINRGAVMLDKNTAYYKGVKRRDETIPAAIVLRKQPIAVLETEYGPILVTQRKSLLVHGEDGASDDPYLARLILNPQRENELIDKVETCVPYLEELPNLRWLHVQATTYYAKYL